MAVTGCTCLFGFRLNICALWHFKHMSFLFTVINKFSSSNWLIDQNKYLQSHKHYENNFKKVLGSEIRHNITRAPFRIEPPHRRTGYSIFLVERGGGRTSLKPKRLGTPCSHSLRNILYYTPFYDAEVQLFVFKNLLVPNF